MCMCMVQVILLKRQKNDIEESFKGFKRYMLTKKDLIYFRGGFKKSNFNNFFLLIFNEVLYLFIVRLSQ